MNDVKTILLIGRTGNGKSTLANVLTGTNGFTEGEFVISETKKIQIEEFEDEDNGINYRIIDTVGIGDTNMTLDRVLRKLALMGYSVKDGLSQILFITDGKLAQEAKSTYYLLKKVVFDDNVADYTTVIRTNFDGFRKEEFREEEKKNLIENSEEFKWLIEECNEIIFVDNPPVTGGNKEEMVLNEGRRRESRAMILNHLKSTFQDQDDDYKPDNLISLGEAIDEQMENKSDLKKKEARGIIPPLIKKNKNRLINNEITEKMLEYIGKIDESLKEVIKEELRKLKEQRKSGREILNPLNWRLFDSRIEVSTKS